ncbi:ribonuclease J [Mycoplasmatota bacterium zrk1]
MKIYNNEVAVFSLGGLCEVGKNCYIIQYRDEIVVIDCGGLFPDDSLLGVDLVLPNLDYLVANQDKIIGVFISHGHEDHIGGISYLLSQVDVPVVYASGLANGLIKRKVKKNILGNKLRDFLEDDIIRSKYFEVTFYRTNHSIPDSFAIVIKTPHGNIIHSGDFKFDFTPIGPMTNLSKISRIADEGVLCLLSDSTNALFPGFTMSERNVGLGIRNIFNNIKGRVIVASFASNIHRVQQIVEASIDVGRKIAIFGRSMENTIKVGTELNYIKAPAGTFINAKELRNKKHDEITILCTGSQGEPLAALSRIATGSHKDIKIIPGDTVIFSSSPIPGNKYSINRTINNLFKRGAHVVVNSPLTGTHTSGHGGQGEQQLLFALTKPKHFIPIHGEYHMLYEHVQTATLCGLPKENCHILENGEVVAFSKKGARKAGRINADGVYVTGSRVSDISNAILRQRKLLSENGILTVVVTVDKKKKQLMGKPLVISRGFIYMKDNEELTYRIKMLSKEITENFLKENKNIQKEKLKSAISEPVYNLIYEITERKPMVIPVIMTA